MRKTLSSVVAIGLIAIGSAYGQVITTGGSVAGRPLAIAGRTAVRFDQLPGNVQEVIRSQAGSGVVASVARGTYSGPAYRVTFMQNGARRTLQFTANGSQLSGDGGLITTPLADGRQITYQQLPVAVKNALATDAASGDIIAVTQGTWRAPVYDALVQAPGQSAQHVIVTQSGGLLQPMAINEAAGAAAPAPPLPQENASTAAGTGVGQTIGGVLAFKDLGWSVQKPMLDHTSYAHIDMVQQMKLPDGRIAYRGLYSKNNQQYQITVAQDGAVISEGLMNTEVAH